MDRPQTFILRSPEILGNCIAMIAQAPTDGTIEVRIRKATDKRRLAQNRTYRMWCADMAVHGDTQKEVHEYLKVKLLAPIYLSDPQGSQQEDWAMEFVEISEMLEGLTRGEANRLIYIHKKVVSTTWASVKQFTEFMNQVDQYAVTKGIPLRYPDEYHIAMGRGE